MNWLACPITHPLIGALALALIAAPAAQAQASATGAPGALTVTPEMFRLRDGSEIPVEAGSFMVPENRADPKSRQIAIHFLRFKSTNPKPGAPIVYLAGGPGGSGIGTARGPRQPVFLALTAVSDVIAFEQRGTGRSNHIEPCEAEAPFDTGQVLSEANYTAYFRATLTRCVGIWRAAGVALEGYTTTESVEDLERLRVGLGAKKLNLWGISYGTHLALAAMRAHPGSIDRAALASVEGMNQTVKLPAALDAAFGRIESTPTAKGALRGSSLTAMMRRVHAKLDAAPLALAMTSPSGASTTVRIDSFPMRVLAGFAAKNPDGIPMLVGAYATVEQGVGEPLAPFLANFLGKPLSLSGMPEMMDLASGISRGRLALVERQAATALTGDTTNFPMPQLNGAVAGIDLGDAFREEIVSDIPTLVISGDLDVRTPLEEQAVATAGLRRAQHLRVRNGGHDLFEAHPAMPKVLSDFFAGRRVTERELVIE